MSMIFIWVYSQALVIFFVFLPAQYLPIIQRGNMIKIAGSPTKNMMQGKAGIASRWGNFHCFQEWLYDVLTRRPIIFVFYLIQLCYCIQLIDTHLLPSHTLVHILMFFCILLCLLPILIF